MKQYFLAEKLKYRRTSLKGLTLFMPLVTVMLAAWLTHIFFAVDSYNWWYMGLYPGYLGILCSVLGRKDRDRKNHTIWSLPVSMVKIWDAKILVGAMMSGAAVFLVAAFTIGIGKLMETGLGVQFIANPTVKMQLLACVVMWVTTLWEIPFCLYLSQKMGTFLMLVLHLAGYTVMAVIPSLMPCFYLFPGAITARVMCPILGILPNGLLLQPGQMTYRPELSAWGSLGTGIVSALLWFFLLWRWSRKQFERQVWKG